MGAVVDARLATVTGDTETGRTATVDHRERWTSDPWRADMHAWIRDALADRGENVTRIDEHRVRIWSAVLRIETDAGVRWAKENHPGSAGEMAATAIAHRVARTLVLEPLAVDVERARLLTADAGVLHEGGQAPCSRCCARWATSTPRSRITEAPAA